MKNTDQHLGGRLSLIKPDALSSEQRKFYEHLQTKTIPWAKQSGFEATTNDGMLIGPFNPMLRSPEIATALMNVEGTESKLTALSEQVRQVVILTVGGVWQAPYELYAHTAVAYKNGLSKEVIQALAEGREPSGLSEEQTIAHRFTKQIITVHQISPDLYKQAINTFGEKGIVDMIVLAGQYMTVSSLLNAFAVPAPNSAQENEDKKEETPNTSIHRFWEEKPARINRHGNFWIPSERVTVAGKIYQQGPMYVYWEAPVKITKPYPIVLVHGGTWQGIEWMDTPDGRPGWAQRLVEAGYAVFIVDRPGHGRSPYHPDIIGQMGQPFDYEEGLHVYFPANTKNHTQSAFDPKDDALLDSFIAAFGPLPANLAKSQEMDADRIAKLLDRIGPSIIITHSASGPVGWLVADRRSKLVSAIVAIEPMSPPFAFTPGIGTLTWGITAAPITYNPPLLTAEEARKADPLSLKIPTLTDLPIALVTSETSVTAANGPGMVAFLKQAGAAAEQIHLPDYGILGNGHGLIFEKNSDQALELVLSWLTAKTDHKQ